MLHYEIISGCSSLPTSQLPHREQSGVVCKNWTGTASHPMTNIVDGWHILLFELTRIGGGDIYSNDGWKIVRNKVSKWATEHCLHQLKHKTILPVFLLSGSTEIFRRNNIWGMKQPGCNNRLDTNRKNSIPFSSDDIGKQNQSILIDNVLLNVC